MSRPTPLVLALALAACSGGGKDTPDGGDAVDGDASAAERTWLLGGRIETYRIDASPLRAVGFEPVGEPPRAEALVVPLDLYGIPWTAFDGKDNGPTELPGAWLSAVDGAVEAAEATGLPIALAVSPISRDADTLAPLAKEVSGSLVLEGYWAGTCFDPAKASDPEKEKRRFGGFVRWLAARHSPRWIFLAERINRYEGCGAGPYAGIVGFATHAHERLQELDPRPVTVVTVDVEDLYGYPKKPGRCVLTTPGECLDVRGPLLDDLHADRLGLETHPALALADLGSIPQSWLTGVAALRPDLPALVSGASLPAVDLETKGTTCQPLLLSTESIQRDFLDRVLSSAAALESELVVWHPLVDLLDAAVAGSCPCSGDAEICIHLDQLGAKADEIRLETTGGLFTGEGEPRLAGNVWTALLPPAVERPTEPDPSPPTDPTTDPATEE